MLSFGALSRTLGCRRELAVHSRKIPAFLELSFLADCDCHFYQCLGALRPLYLGTSVMSQILCFGSGRTCDYGNDSHDLSERIPARAQSRIDKARVVRCLLAGSSCSLPHPLPDMWASSFRAHQTLDQQEATGRSTGVKPGAASMTSRTLGPYTASGSCDSFLTFESSPYLDRHQPGVQPITFRMARRARSNMAERTA